MNRFDKLRIALRHFLHGAASQDKSFLIPLRAFDFAMQHHTGTRKDGVTPEFVHQLETTLYLRTLMPALLYPAETLAAMLLHDVGEDYGVSHAQQEDLFGKRVAHATLRLSKVVNGIRISDEQYFHDMVDCPIATVCKGPDRGHNQQTMGGVFSPAKQGGYLDETERWILPMLKKAQRRWPEQDAAYENLKFLLRSQVSLIRQTLAAQP